MCRWKDRIKIYTLKPTYNGTARDRYFIAFPKVPFNTDTLMLEIIGTVKNFPLGTGFRYAQVPFNTGFTRVHERNARKGTVAGFCDKYSET
jgi:hypothetical protein